MGNQAQYSFTETTGWGAARKSNHLYKIFHNLLPETDRSMTLLEIGSGRGEFAEIVKNSGMKYIGVEPSKYLREKLEARGFDILSDPVPHLAVADNSVDIVYTYDVLEHMENYSTILSFFNEAKRVLKDDGYIIVIAPNAETLGNLFYLHEYQHNYFTSAERTTSLLQDSEFDIVAVKSFLTGVGLSKIKILNIVDRIFAHVILVFARNIFLTACVRAIIGKNLLFKIHKNLYDHFSVLAKLK